MGNILYPIKKENLDLQLYLLVKTIMMIRSTKAYQKYSPEFHEEEQLGIKELAYQLRHDCVYLIFPSLHRQFRLYPKEISKYSTIIAVYDEKYSIYYSQGRDDHYYNLKSFYTLDYIEKEGKEHLELKPHPVIDLNEGLPVFYDNTKELLEALNRLLEFMESVHLEENEWYKRLTYSREMLVRRKDGLRILHNMGFFDIIDLFQVLSTVGINELVISEMMSAYTDSVRVFAMSVVNGVYTKTLDSHKKPKQVVVRPKYDRDKQLRWQNRHEPLIIQEKKQYTIPVETQPVKKDMEKMRGEKNSRILKNIIWYVVGMLVLVGIILLAKYSLTGSVTISVGVISAIIIRNIHRLEEGYEDDDPQPQWFRTLLLFTAIIVIFGGIVVCKLFSEFIYDVTGGLVTPWKLFFIVAFVMIGIFVLSMNLKKGKKGKKSRIYTFLMLLSLSILLGQCVGSLGYSSDLDHEQWKQSLKKLDQENEKSKKIKYEKGLVGTWTVNDIFYGEGQVIEKFNGDGTWERGNAEKAEGIKTTGRWSYVGNEQIKIQMTGVIVGSTYDHSENEWFLKIIYLHEGEMACQKGDYTIIYRRTNDKHE